MSDESREHSAALHLSTSSVSEPTAPPWLTQAIVLMQAWWSGWLLLPLVEHVRLARGRAGKFEVVDFVLVLLAYASSEARTLKAFYQQARPTAQVLMGAWGRNGMPSRSALSRFLKDVTPTAVEALRDFFLTSWSTVRAVPNWVDFAITKAGDGSSSTSTARAKPIGSAPWPRVPIGRNAAGVPQGWPCRATRGASVARLYAGA
jgi:hypothetical protein